MSSFNKIKQSSNIIFLVRNGQTIRRLVSRIIEPLFSSHSKRNQSVHFLNLIFSTDIYLFEANPVFNTALVQAKEQFDTFGTKINIFPSTVVDVKDGTRTFFLDTVNVKHDFWGSSTYASHPDAIKSKSNGTELSAINISRWLLMNTLPRDFVVVKMDIEGAEYDILPHMVEMSAWIVIDYLLVEWHPRVLRGAKAKDNTLYRARAEAAVEKLKANGVSMPHYNSPA